MLKRRKLVAIMLVVMLVSTVIGIPSAETFAANTTYYVDSLSGNDSNNGMSQSSAWKSLSNVNTFTFESGDRILFKAGGQWTGQLYPKGSGTSGNPIVIDMYGTGNKPVINGGGSVTEAVKLYNQEYWEINNLEVTNTAASAGTRIGIAVYGNDYGTINHIYIKNCYVHDVTGNNADKNTGGIMFKIYGTTKVTIFNDILVDSCTVYNVDRSGIWTWSNWYTRPGSTWGGGGVWTGSTNVVIQNCIVDNIGGDGIVPQVCSNPMVQYNIAKDCNKRANSPNVGIWPFNCDNAVFQYNESYLTRTTKDGQGFDSDYNCNNTLFQYNYSHDNEGGFMLVCSPGTSETGVFNNNTVIRYNISQNDGTRGIQMMGATTVGTSIYNNTIFVGSGSNMTRVIANDSWGGYAGTTKIENNIFYVQNNSILEDKSDWTYNNNCYYGITAPTEDTAAIKANPKFVSPGSGAIGRNTVDGYKLLTGSLCLVSGKVINNNGGKDYWGNTVSSSSLPNIGAYNGIGIQTSAPVNYVINGGMENGTLSPWSVWNDASISSTNAKTGNYCMRIGNGPASVEQIITVEPNTTYVLSGYANAPSGQEVRIGTKNYGGTEKYASVTSTSYSQGKVTFTTGASNTKATIYIYHPSGTGNSFADDIFVEKQVNVPTNHVLNGGMENGTLSPWSVWNDAAISNTNAKTGNYCVRIGSGPASVEQLITVEPNTTYVLSGYAYAPAGQEVRIGVKNYGGTEKYAAITGTSYSQGTVTFTTGASNTKATIYIYHPSGTGNGYADDIVVLQQ